jgi:hypothetical protein
MTVWFAQNSTVNIDSANQWNDVADGSGNFLTFGDLDPADILVANAKTSITCNVSFTCLRITTSDADGGTAGGGFLLAAGVTVTADVVAGTTICLTRSAAGDESFVVGDVTGGSGANTIGVRNTSTATLTITGNVTGGSGGGAYGADNTSTGTIAITGNMTGGSGGNAFGARNNSTGTLTIAGDVTGGSGSNALGAGNNSTGTLNIVGSVTGGSSSNATGALNAASGRINIIGDCIASASASAVSGSLTGIMYVNGDFIANANGNTALGGGIIVIDDDSAMSHTYRMLDEFGVAGPRSLFTANTLDPTVVPIEADVRFGVDYAASERTGTLRVPAPEFVSQGVLTDDTVGTLSAGLDEAALHAALDSYANKDDWKSTPLDATQTQQAAADAITAAVPANFASLGINSDGHISRVVLVDTCTANTDMRGTDNALLASSYTAPANGDIAAIKAKTDNLPNDPATLAKQDEILGAIGDIDCGGGGGLTGDYTLTVTVTDADTSEPIENATVTLSRTGERGAELTDVNGVAVVGLDAATWSWVVRAAGYESRTGTVVVSGDQALSVEMDGIVVSPSEYPPGSTGL